MKTLFRIAVVSWGPPATGPNLSELNPAPSDDLPNLIKSNLIKDLVHLKKSFHFSALLDLPSLIAASHFMGDAKRWGCCFFTCHLFKCAETQFFGTETFMPFSALLERTKERASDEP